MCSPDSSCFHAVLGVVSGWYSTIFSDWPSTEIRVAGVASTDRNVTVFASPKGHGFIRVRKTYTTFAFAFFVNQMLFSLVTIQGRTFLMASPLTKFHRAISRNSDSCSIGISPSGRGPIFSSRLPPLARVSISVSINWVPDLYCSLVGRHGHSVPCLLYTSPSPRD